VYRECRGQTDFVIVCDCDEFLWHADLRGILQRRRGQSGFFRTQGYQMVSGRFPVLRDLFEEVRLGVPHAQFSKRVCFSPDVDIRFDYGCHRSECAAKPFEEVLDLYHCKFLGLQETLERNSELGRRLEPNDAGFGQHWQNQALIAAAFVETLIASKPVPAALAR
jgi:hypothetical protein